MVSSSGRGFNILVGSLLLIFAILGFIFAIETFWLLMLINSILMIILGISLVVDRPLRPEQKLELERTAAIIVGIVLVILGVLITIGSFLNPLVAAEIFVYLMAIGMILFAVYIILWGLKKRKARWGMALISIFLAILVIIFAILIFFLPVFGANVILFFVQIIFIILGARMLIVGIFPETQY